MKLSTPLRTVLLPLISSILFYSASATTCAQDNCLRALTNRLPTATPFCSTYTLAPASASAPIPTAFTSQCANDPSRVSSACSCIATLGARNLHRVYGGTNGIDGTEYTIFEQSVNIRSDPQNAGDQGYDYFYNNCKGMCEYYANRCQTFSFVQKPGFYLCYIYPTLFQPEKMSASLGAVRNVVEQRYQS